LGFAECEKRIKQAMVTLSRANDFVPQNPSRNACLYAKRCLGTGETRLVPLVESSLCEALNSLEGCHCATIGVIHETLARADGYLDLALKTIESRLDPAEDDRERIWRALEYAEASAERRKEIHEEELDQQQVWVRRKGAMGRKRKRGRNEPTAY